MFELNNPKQNNYPKIRLPEVFFFSKTLDNRAWHDFTFIINTWWLVLNECFWLHNFC